MGTTAKQSGAEVPRLYRELPAHLRWRRGLLTAFTLYHLAAVLVGGALEPVRQALAPVFGFYDQGLHMTNTWGMFGKRPISTHVLIEAELASGERRVLSSTRAADRTLFERVRDVRVRKLQGRLADEADRLRWGQDYLDYFCRDAAARGLDVVAMRAWNEIHESRNDDGRVDRRASRRALLYRSCKEPRRAAGAVHGPLFPPSRREEP